MTEVTAPSGYYTVRMMPYPINMNSTYSGSFMRYDQGGARSSYPIYQISVVCQTNNWQIELINLENNSFGEGGFWEGIYSFIAIGKQ